MHRLVTQQISPARLNVTKYNPEKCRNVFMKIIVFPKFYYTSYNMLDTWGTYLTIVDGLLGYL